jgi:hypothetical protein
VTVIAPLFLTCANRAADAIGAPEVAAAWETPSALEGYTVAGLAGHLARAVLTVETYLDRADAAAPTSAEGLTDASGYLVAVLGDADPIRSDLHTGVRRRGEETAADGPAALAARVRETTERLHLRLDEDTLARPVGVLDGVVLTVADYLRTRIVELVVHLDDLAVSVDRPLTDGLPDAAFAEVADVLARVAVRRHGGLATVRALARGERHPEAVRAL